MGYFQAQRSVSNHQEKSIQKKSLKKIKDSYDEKDIGTCISILIFLILFF